MQDTNALIYLVTDKEPNIERQTEKLPGIVIHRILQKGDQGKPYTLWLGFYGRSDMYKWLDLVARFSISADLCQCKWNTGLDRAWHLCVP